MGIQLPAVRFSRIKRELKKGKLPCDIYGFHCQPDFCWFYSGNSKGIYPDGDSICNQRLAEQIEYEAGKIDKPWWYIEGG